MILVSFYGRRLFDIHTHVPYPRQRPSAPGPARDFIFKILRPPGSQLWDGKTRALSWRASVVVVVVVLVTMHSVGHMTHLANPHHRIITFSDSILMLKHTSTLALVSSSHHHISHFLFFSGTLENVAFNTRPNDVIIIFHFSLIAEGACRHIHIFR